MPQPSATKPLGSPFIELQSVDSTNNYARQQIHAGLAQDGMAIFAHEQLAGKGQRGKTWLSEKGANLVLSIIVKPHPLQLAQQFQLSACAAVAIHEFFMDHAGEETKIKWPNDLYWQDRKAGGILIENIVAGTGHDGKSREWTSIIGIGININQTTFETGLKNPVSLKQITGKNFDLLELAKTLCICLDKWFKQLKENGFQPIYDRYLAHLYKRNELVRLKKDSRIFEAKIKGVSPLGKLSTQHAIEQEFDFGEIEWVIK